MKFSVIIPLFNKELYIQRTIDSVLAQSFLDYEVIIVDDSSTDHSLELASKYITSNIKVIKKDKGPSGPSATRNLGIDNAKGKWIAFLDAADRWYPEHLSKLHELIEQDSTINFISNGWNRGIDDKSLSKDNYTGYWQKRKHNSIVSFEKFLTETIAGHPPFWSSACAVRKNSFIKLGGFPEEIIRGEDISTWLKLMYNNKRALRSLYIGATYFRDDDESITKKTLPTLERIELPITDFELIKNTKSKKLLNLLMQFSNYYVKMGLTSRLKRGKLNNKDVKSLFFKANKLKYVKYIILSIIPKQLIISLIYNYRILKKSIKFHKI